MQGYNDPFSSKVVFDPNEDVFETVDRAHGTVKRRGLSSVDEAIYMAVAENRLTLWLSLCIVI